MVDLPQHQQIAIRHKPLNLGHLLRAELWIGQIYESHPLALTKTHHHLFEMYANEATDRVIVSDNYGKYKIKRINKHKSVGFIKLLTVAEPWNGSIFVRLFNRSLLFFISCISAP